MKDPAPSSAKRANLGRGLAALFGEEAPQAPGGAAPRTLPIEALQPGRLQPRTVFSEESLEALTESIRAQGILQPLIVRPLADQPGRFEIVAGERRWRAAQRARLHEVPVILRELTDAQALELALVENVQRQDLDALEEAEGYRRLIEEFHHRQEDLARLIGKSRSHIANTLRLLQLSPGVKALLQKGALSAGHARALLTAPEADRLAETVVAKGLSVRDTERLAASERKAPGEAGQVGTAAVDPDLAALQEELSGRLGLRVKISTTGQGGTLSISYRSLEQFDSLLARLRG